LLALFHNGGTDSRICAFFANYLVERNSVSRNDFDWQAGLAYQP